MLYGSLSGYALHALTLLRVTNDSLNCCLQEIFLQITQTMQIPLTYAEDIIGVKGANIAYIRANSGAVVTIQESLGSPDDITVEIKGTSSQVQAAQQLIQVIACMMFLRNLDFSSVYIFTPYLPSGLVSCTPGTCQKQLCGRRIRSSVQAQLLTIWQLHLQAWVAIRRHHCHLILASTMVDIHLLDWVAMGQVTGTSSSSSLGMLGASCICS